MENQSKSNPKFKFLRKDMHVDTAPQQVLAYTKLKRVFFRRINERFTVIKRSYYSKGKQCVCLKSVRLTLKSESHCVNLAKTCKNLKYVDFEVSYGNPSLKLATSFTKRLSKNIETICFSGPNVKTKLKELHSLYRNLGTYQNLQVLVKGLETTGPSAEHEYRFLSRYMKRIKTVTEIECIQDSGNQKGFMNFMKRSQIYPYLTDLAIAVSETGVEGEDDDELGDNDEYIEDLNTNKLSCFFRFNIFPNIKNLEISFWDNQEFLFEPFVIEGFKSLQKLECLSFIINGRLSGLEFLAEALLYLPELTSFSFHLTSNLEIYEKDLLAEFLQKQNKLVFLYFVMNNNPTLEKDYQRKNQFLIDICQSLDKKPNLKYLTLLSRSWTLESLSKGLSKTTTCLHLEELDIEIFDNFVTSSLPACDRVEGFCDFIKRQKSSIKSLTIVLPIVKEDYIIESLIMAISELEKLDTLYFIVNPGIRGNFYGYRKILNGIFWPGNQKESIKGCPAYAKTFSYLNEALQKLSTLSHLNLNFSPLEMPDVGPNINLYAIFETISTLRRLKYLTVGLPSSNQYSEHEFSKVKELLKLGHLIQINIVDSKGNKIDKAEKILEPTEKWRKLQRRLVFLNNLQD